MIDIDTLLTWGAAYKKLQAGEIIFLRITFEAEGAGTGFDLCIPFPPEQNVVRIHVGSALNSGGRFGFQR